MLEKWPKNSAKHENLHHYPVSGGVAQDTDSEGSDFLRHCLAFQQWRKAQKNVPFRARFATQFYVDSYMVSFGSLELFKHC